MSKPFWLLMSIVAMAGLLSGFDAAIISGALVFITRYFSLQENTFLQELIVSVVVVGGLFGALIASKLSFFCGRRSSIFLTALIFLIGTLCITLTTSIRLLIIGRLVLGVAVGLASMVAPLYLSELSPAKYRGRCVFFYQLAVTLGFIVAYSVNFCWAHNGNWRAMFAVGVIPAGLLILGVRWLPESPRWLVAKNREQEAQNVLDKFPYDPDLSIAAIHNNLIQVDIQLNAMLSKPILPLLITAILLFCLQSFSGINAIFYYAQTIFSQAGFAENTGAMLASIGLGVANFIAACVGSLLADFIGRRKLLLASYLGMITCLFLLGSLPKNAALFSFALLFIYTFCFGVGLGGIPYIFMAEVFPLKFRDKCMTLASAIGLWGSNIVVLLSFLSLTKLIGMSFVFYLYGVISFLGFCYCWKILPETSRVSLEALEKQLLLLQRKTN